jgi:hypothetical protein
MNMVADIFAGFLGFLEDKMYLPVIAVAVVLVVAIFMTFRKKGRSFPWTEPW